MVAFAVILLLLALLCGGIGFALHTLWLIAVLFLIAAAVVYVFNGPRRS